MKTNFNQIGLGIGKAVFSTVACLVISNFSVLAVDVPEKSSVEPVVVMLAPGVSGEDIQSALNSLPDAGGEVVLPAGTFSIRQPLVLHRNFQTLRGAGASTVLRVADDANCPAVIMGEPVNHPQQTVHDLVVRDLYIDGNRAHQTREVWRLAGEGAEIRNNGITVQGVADSLVRDVVTTECRSGGLVTTREVRRLTVRGLESFHNEFDGLACYETEDCLFADLNLHDNPGAGISLDLAFNHNVISNATLNSNDLGVFMRSSRDNQFYNVSIENSHHNGVFMAHVMVETAHGVQMAPQSECTYNAFTNLIAVNCGGAAFRVNDPSCTNNVLIRANFNGNRTGVSEVRADLVMMR